jgi:hypothetical protein
MSAKQWAQTHLLLAVLGFVGILSAAVVVCSLLPASNNADGLNLEVHDCGESRAMVDDDDLEEHGTFKPTDGMVDLI